METLREIVCKNFNRLVDSSDLSKKDIADKIGVTPATMQRWKNGENPPDLENIQALSELFNVDPSDFYRADVQKVTPLPVSKTLQKMMAIPDEVYELANDLSLNHSAWEHVKNILEGAVEDEKVKRLSVFNK